MMLSAVLKKDGIRCQIIDQGLGDELPDGDLFFTGTTPQVDEMEKFMFKGYRVLGGPHASIDPEETYRTSLYSCVVAGEGENVIKDILIYRPTGIIRAPRITDLDSLPFPDRTVAHRYNWTIDGRKATTMVTSRGCTGKCAFCCRTLDRKIIISLIGDKVLFNVIPYLNTGGLAAGYLRADRPGPGEVIRVDAGGAGDQRVGRA